MHKSISTINAPEFINLQPLDINPLMSACEIKVFYLGENRNHSYISKEVATDMAKTLRGAPIVGYFKQDKGDFADHGEKVILDGDGIHFECQTTPYGFVDPSAKVWFQTFTDYDDFGNEIEREYLMTTGYLWTGQFEECQSVIDQGKPHSMELDEKTIQGKWSTNIKNDIEFFIINDAIFSKLCILGDDVEPCFEGSSITAPEVSKKFSLDDKFTTTLESMMKDLKFALQGGKTMLDNQVAAETIEEPVVVTVFDESSDSSESTESESISETSEDVSETENTEEENEPVALADTDPDISEEEKAILTENDETLPAKKSFTKDEEKKEDEASESEEEKDEEKEDKEKDDNKKVNHTLEEYSLLESKFNALQNDYNNLIVKCEELTKFKNSIEDKEKDAMIDRFYKLSDAELKDIRENKSQYTVDEIESKLAVLYCRKGLSFEEPKIESTIEEKPVITYNLDTQIDLVPDWIKAIEETQKSRNI